MSTVEFFTKVRDRLKDGGVMVVNMNMYSDSADSINDYLADTVAAVFPCVCAAPAGSTGNLELFASRSPGMRENLAAALPGLRNADLRTAAGWLADSLTDYEDGGLRFTDDKAPVEMLGMRVIDEIITEELDYYRGLFREEGFSALLG